MTTEKKTRQKALDFTVEFTDAEFAAYEKFLKGSVAPHDVRPYDGDVDNFLRLSKTLDRLSLEDSAKDDASRLRFHFLELISETSKYIRAKTFKMLLERDPAEKKIN